MLVGTTTLRGGAWDTLGSGMVCTLGDGVRIMQDLGVRSWACAIQNNDGADKGWKTGGCHSLVVRREKIVLSSLMARYWASPGCWYGALGCRFAIALARVMAAWVASSAGEEEGTAQLCGKNSMVMLLCSPRDAGI